MQVQKTSARKNAQPKIDRRDPRKLRQPATKDGGEQTAAHDDAIRGPRFSVLAGQLSTVTKFEMLAHFGSNDEEQYEILNMIDTEEKQLQAISDLYQIVKAQPKYKGLKDRSWPAETSPLEIILWLLRKLGPLAEGREWTIDTYKQGRKTRYRYVTWLGFHRQAVMDKEIHFPLDFLPLLKKRDLELHDLVVDAIALVSRSNKIPIWDRDGDYSHGLERILEEPYLASIMNVNCEDYQAGLPAQYLKLIRGRMRIKDLDADIRKRVLKYKGESQRKNGAIGWIKWAVDIAATKQTLQPYSFVPNYIKASSPIGPQRLYKFVWSEHWKDYVQKIAEARLRDDEKYGVFLPVMYSAVIPGKKLVPIHDNYKKLTQGRSNYILRYFPERLFCFLNEGWKHFNQRHREYYYKNNDGETATEAYYRLTDPPKAEQRIESNKLLINILDNE